MFKKKPEINKDQLNLIRKEIQSTQLILIITVTILLSFGSAFLNITSIEKNADQVLQDTSKLITRLYGFTENLSHEELCTYMDSVVKELPDIDVVSIVDKNNIRIYHTNHDLIGTEFDGSHPDFSTDRKDFFTENSTGPSGPQRRTYCALQDKNGNYCGFLMTIRLKTSIRNICLRTIALFGSVSIIAILIEITICGTISQKIKRQFIKFAEDLEGTKFLVDSMRANNHDFTNKLHVILGLIQIGQYDNAINYIEDISIIQQKTLSKVMNSIDNSSFAALIIGKIARANECNVKFIIKDDIHFSNADVELPSEALITITGNLIDNALDAMNQQHSSEKNHQLEFGVYTKPENLLISVKDNGHGIPENIQDKIFENGFSTKGSGRGVGLYHTKQLVENLGGKIFFKSTPNKGSHFMVEFKKGKNNECL